jgi:tetratricopeptide (TPR) repeat protein
MLCCLFAAAMFGFLGQNGLAPGSPTATAKAFRPGGDVPSTSAADAQKQPLTREMRGDIFMARKMYREAVAQYELSPESANIQNKIGIAYHQLQDLRTAKKYYQRAVRLNSTYPDALNNLGTVYYSEKNYRRAITQYRKALHIAPRSATIYSNLGSAYFSRKDYKRAVENYQTALSLDPEVFDHRGTTGVLLQERSVEDKATYHYFMARVYAKQGDTDRALQYVRKALEEGFKDRRKFREDPDFAGLQKLPEFVQLMNTEQRVL